MAPAHPFALAQRLATPDSADLPPMQIDRLLRCGVAVRRSNGQHVWGSSPSTRLHAGHEADRIILTVPGDNAQCLLMAWAAVLHWGKQGVPPAACLEIIVAIPGHDDGNSGTTSSIGGGRFLFSDLKQECEQWIHQAPPSASTRPPFLSKCNMQDDSLLSRILETPVSPGLQTKMVPWCADGQPALRFAIDRFDRNTPGSRVMITPENTLYQLPLDGPPCVVIRMDERFTNLEQMNFWARGCGNSGCPRQSSSA